MQKKFIYQAQRVSLALTAKQKNDFICLTCLFLSNYQSFSRDVLFSLSDYLDIKIYVFDTFDFFDLYLDISIKLLLPENSQLFDLFSCEKLGAVKSLICTANYK